MQIHIFAVSINEIAQQSHIKIVSVQTNLVDRVKLDMCCNGSLGDTKLKET